MPRPPRVTRSVASLAFVLGALFAIHTTAQASPETDARVKAKSFFREGNAAYEQHDYARALDLFTEAYHVYPAPGLLFNIAQCYRELGMLDKAAFFYEQYLREPEKNPARRHLAQKLLGELQAELARREAVERREQRERAKRLRQARKRASPAAKKPGPEVKEPSPPARGASPPAGEERRRERRLDQELATAPGFAEAETSEPLIYERWWFWAATGTVVLGATVFALSRDGDDSPSLSADLPPPVGLQF
jgi:tetratricopeptide (TPR) repeat protein